MAEEYQFDGYEPSLSKGELSISGFGPQGWRQSALNFLGSHSMDWNKMVSLLTFER